MGGSDFQAVQPYTYDDLPNGVQTDFNLNYFNISKDRDFVIPILKEALSINPSLKILGTPWSAPAWLKKSNKLNGGEIKTDTSYLQTYAEFRRTRPRVSTLMRLLSRTSLCCQATAILQ